MASILELDIDDVPAFELLGKDTWKSVLDNYLREMGFLFIESSDAIIESDYYICTGESSRGNTHCVIYRNRKMVHDPHPENNGLISINKYWSLIPAISNIEAKIIKNACHLKNQMRALQGSKHFHDDVSLKEKANRCFHSCLALCELSDSAIMSRKALQALNNISSSAVCQNNNVTLPTESGPRFRPMANEGAYATNTTERT